MQRKSNFLKHSRNGMAMIMAIAAIVVIATISALAIRLTSQTTKSTVDLYLYEQANLYARSAAEYAILKIENENNTTNRCHYMGESEFTENNIYNIKINVKYIYSSNISSCGYITLQQTELFGAALIDIIVTVSNTDIANEPIRIFKRKLLEL